MKKRLISILCSFAIFFTISMPLVPAYAFDSYRPGERRAFTQFPATVKVTVSEAGYYRFYTEGDIYSALYFYKGPTQPSISSSMSSSTRTFLEPGEYYIRVESSNGKNGTAYLCSELTPRMQLSTSIDQTFGYETVQIHATFIDPNHPVLYVNGTNVGGFYFYNKYDKEHAYTYSYSPDEPGTYVFQIKDIDAAGNEYFSNTVSVDINVADTRFSQYPKAFPLLSGGMTPQLENALPTPYHNSATWKLGADPAVCLIGQQPYISLGALAWVCSYRSGPGMFDFYLACGPSIFDFQIGSTDVLVNNEWISIPHPVRSISNFTYFPLDFVTDVLGCHAVYSPSDGLITLDAPLPYYQYAAKKKEQPAWCRYIEQTEDGSMFLNGKKFASNSFSPIRIEEELYLPISFLTACYGAVTTNPQENTTQISFYENHQMYALYYANNKCALQTSSTGEPYLVEEGPSIYPLLTPALRQIPAVWIDKQWYIPLSFFTKTLQWAFETDDTAGAWSLSKKSMHPAAKNVTYLDNGAPLPAVNRLSVQACSDGKQVFWLQDGVTATSTQDFMTKTPVSTPIYGYLTALRAANGSLYIRNRSVFEMGGHHVNYATSRDETILLQQGSGTWCSVPYAPTDMLYQDGLYYGVAEPGIYCTSKDGLLWDLADSSVLPTAAHEGSKAMFFDKPFMVKAPETGFTYAKPGHWTGTYHNDRYLAQSDGDLYTSEDGELWEHLTDLTKDIIAFGQIIPAGDGFYAQGRNIETKQEGYFFIEKNNGTWTIEQLHAPDGMEPLNFDALYYANGALYQTESHGNKYPKLPD